MMRYKKGYKYQVVETFETQTSILAGKQISVNYITLYRDGVLSIASGYASDGPSGITFDTKNFMRGAFVHDALYELMRLGFLSCDHKQQADQELRRICLEDGMWKIRAWWVYVAVDKFGRGSTLPENKKEIIEAP